MEPERPNIQIDDLVRPMTDEEYTNLLATGWTMESVIQKGNIPEPWTEPTG